MEVLHPAASDPSPLIQDQPAAAAATAPVGDDEIVQSPRTKRLVSQLLQRVFSLERLMRSRSDDQQQQQQQNGDIPPSTATVAAAAAAAAAAVVVAARRYPYSALEKNPSCPYVFQMPLHYPRYTREEYESMPEWQLDRLLEEYGVPITGSLKDKRDYAMGAFLWRN